MGFEPMSSITKILCPKPLGEFTEVTLYLDIRFYSAEWGIRTPDFFLVREALLTAELILHMPFSENIPRRLTVPTYDLEGKYACLLTKSNRGNPYLRSRCSRAKRVDAGGIEPPLWEPKSHILPLYEASILFSFALQSHWVGKVGFEPTCNQLRFRHFIRVSRYFPILWFSDLLRITKNPENSYRLLTRPTLRKVPTSLYTTIIGTYTYKRKLTPTTRIILENASIQATTPTTTSELIIMFFK